MPYTKKQQAAFRAAAHDPKTRKAMGLTEHEARKLMLEAQAKKKRPAKSVLSHG